MPLGDRKKLVLRAVVDDYIKTAEPVGSKTLVESRKLSLSSATVRNEMSELEQMGYLDKPHTSAGRIPSALGYRLYVDELMRRRRPSAAEMRAINEAIESHLREAGRLISEAGRLVAELTRYAAYATSPQTDAVSLKHIDILLVDAESVVFVLVLSTNNVKNKYQKRPPGVTDDKAHLLAKLINERLSRISAAPGDPALIAELAKKSGAPVQFVAALSDFICETLEHSGDWDVYIGGMGHIFDQPEYMRDIYKAQRLLEHLSDPGAMKRMPLPPPGDEVKVLIGPENVAEALKDSSVMLASYNLGGGVRGLVGVVGPTRMDYSGVEARLSYFISRMNQFFRAAPEDGTMENDK